MSFYPGGGVQDDVAANIRAEQQADAMPSPEEHKDDVRRVERFHAELKAALALVEALDRDQHVDIAFAVADHCGFESFDRYRTRVSRAHAGLKQWSDIRENHLEPHESPVPEEFDGQAPDVAFRPPFAVTEQARELKADAWQQLPDPAATEIQTSRLSAGGALRYRVRVISPLGKTQTQLVEASD